MDGIERLVGKNGVIDLILVFTTEWRLLQKHLVDQDTKCPPVDCSSVLLVKQDLYPLASGRQTSERPPTSGAMNSGVPQKVLVVEPYHMSSLQRP